MHSRTTSSSSAEVSLLAGLKQELAATLFSTEDSAPSGTTRSCFHGCTSWMAIRHARPSEDFATSQR